MSAAIVAAPTFTAPASAAVVPPCVAFAMSPTFAVDRTAACSFVVESGQTTKLVIAVTKNAGRSWRVTAGSGLSTSGSRAAFTPTFSPRYRQDRGLFVGTDAGLHVSRDDGATWIVADPLVQRGSRENPVPFVAPALVPGAPGMGGERVYVAYAAGAQSARLDVDAAVHQPATGVVSGTKTFVPRRLADGTSEVLALGRSDGRTLDGVVTTFTMYGCTTALSCAEPLFEFPTASDAHVWVGARNDVFVSLSRYDRGTPWYEVWRSTDGGRKFAVWRSATKLIQPSLSDAHGFMPTIGIATNPAFPRRVYLRISTASISRSVPAEQVFRSDDAGVTWRRTGFQRDYGQRGPRGTLPWSGGGGVADGSGIFLGGDGRLFAVGSAEGLQRAPFCSTDGGYRWHFTCR